ncbi:hypothetical protein [Halobellus salinisoli]|uniref:hypothetical protein n=1 Tax=Halobellus salinisoli TaxID=3108500 RepID=UPI00300BC063
MSDEPAVTGRSRWGANRGIRIVAFVLFATFSAVVVFADPVLAHAGSLGAVSRSAPVPSWLVIASGAGVVGASFLFTSLLTDRQAIEGFPRRGRSLALTAVGSGLGRIARWTAVAAVPLVVAVGLIGPDAPAANLLTLVVWVVWWAGYTMTTYAVGDTWPALNPWRTVASLIPLERRSLPDWVGAWPSVVALLALVAIEVLSPVAADPRLLAAVVIGYSTVTVAGAAAFGDAWFDRIDPVARTFALYGRFAPVRRTDSGLDVGLPGAGLARDTTVSDPDDVAFIVGLVWVTTFDGLVSTAAWERVTSAVAALGVPVWVVTLAGLLGGFACFVACYWLAARGVRRTAPTYVSTRYLAGWFAPALVPIAAGYHFAHFVGYLVGFAPTIAAVVASPLAPPGSLVVLSPPGWFGAVQVIAIVLGHILAVWVAHARAFELFAGRVQPIRSQYPFALVAVLYTTVSLWIVAQPIATGIR